MQYLIKQPTDHPLYPQKFPKQVNKPNKDVEITFGNLHLSSLFTPAKFNLAKNNGITGSFKTPMNGLTPILAGLDFVGGLAQIINEQKKINKSGNPKEAREQQERFNANDRAKLFGGEFDKFKSSILTLNSGGVLKAQNGTTLYGPTISAKKYPVGTIVTNDPNDPRLQPYQDSLLVHNAGEKAYRDFMQSRTSLGLSNTSWSRIKNRYNSPNVISAANRLEKLNNEELSFGKQTPYAPIWEGSTEVEIGRIGVLNKPIQPIIYQPFVNRMQPIGMPTSSQLIPNPRIMPDVIYKDNNIPNAAYTGFDITHFTDSLGRWAAKFNASTTPGIRGKISIPNPNGNFIIN